jgi:hypothetical protein
MPLNSSGGLIGACEAMFAVPLGKIIPPDKEELPKTIEDPPSNVPDVQLPDPSPSSVASARVQTVIPKSIAIKNFFMMLILPFCLKFHL